MLHKIATTLNIDFYKIKDWKEWENNHDASSISTTHKISQLQQCDQTLRNAIMQARETGCELQIESSFKIKLVK